MSNSIKDFLNNIKKLKIRYVINKITIKILVLEKILNNLHKVRMHLWIILLEINKEIINKKYKVIMIRYQVNKV